MTSLVVSSNWSEADVRTLTANGGECKTKKLWKQGTYSSRTAIYTGGQPSFGTGIVQKGFVTLKDRYDSSYLQLPHSEKLIV